MLDPQYLNILYILYKRGYVTADPGSGLLYKVQQSTSVSGLRCSKSDPAKKAKTVENNENEKLSIVVGHQRTAENMELVLNVIAPLMTK